MGQKVYGIFLRVINPPQSEPSGRQSLSFWSQGVSTHITRFKEYDFRGKPVLIFFFHSIFWDDPPTLPGRKALQKHRKRRSDHCGISKRAPETFNENYKKFSTDFLCYFISVYEVVLKNSIIFGKNMNSKIIFLG
jgi:hypothetical protein